MAKRQYLAAFAAFLISFGAKVPEIDVAPTDMTSSGVYQ